MFRIYYEVQILRNVAMSKTGLSDRLYNLGINTCKIPQHGAARRSLYTSNVKVKVPNHWKVVFHVQDLLVCIISDVPAWTGRVADISLQTESWTVRVMAQGVTDRYF
jgi:hypothetical protein